MNRMLFLISFISVAIILDFYIAYALRKSVFTEKIFQTYVVVHLVYYIFLFYGAFIAPPTDFWRHFILISLSIFYLPKIFLAFILLLEDCTRIIRYGFSFTSSTPHLPSRRTFISQIGLAIAAIPFFSVLHGIFFGRYNFRVFNQPIFFDDLPDAFDGFKILQISDIHSGSFDNIEKVRYGVDLINEQKADLFVFTGDLVNSLASEFKPYVPLFKTIKAPYGQFSIMGNHDYGYYGNRNNERSEEENVTFLKKNDIEFQKIHQETGFTLLKNEMRKIEKDGQFINLVGVENWGASEYFPKKGNLALASAEVKSGEFTVLLSHDPSHFDFTEAKYSKEDQSANLIKEVPIIDFPKKMHLTLSGHTHGGQMGIEIPGIKWSPVKYFYKKWAGLYQEKGRYLYVNRGFGYLAFPGRIGEFPEITVIELRKKK